MADKHIDHDETQSYGPHASNQIRIHVVGLVKEFDAGLLFLAGSLDDATRLVQQEVARARAADGKLREGVLDKAPAATAAVDVLTRFGKHLDSHRRGTIDRRAFFVDDGTVQAAKAGGPGMVLVALRHIQGELKKKGSPVADPQRWVKEVGAAIDGLAPALGATVTARTARRSTTPDVARAHRAWRSTYGATKRVVEGLLRLAGKVELMPQIFHDLAVPERAPQIPPPQETPAPPAH